MFASDHAAMREPFGKSFWDVLIPRNNPCCLLRFVQAFQEAGGFDPTDPHRDPEPWEQMDWLYRATDYLKTRPDFAEFLPHGWAFPERAELDLPKDEPPCDTIGDELDRPWNQETNAVDLRARMEKRRYKTKQNEKWAKERARVGTSPGIDVVAGDVRYG